MNMRILVAALIGLAFAAGCSTNNDRQATLDEALSTTKPPTPISEIEQSVAEDLQGMSNGSEQITVDCPTPDTRRYSIVCTVDGGGGVVSVVGGIYHGVRSVRVIGNRYGGFSWEFVEARAGRG